MKKDTEVKRNMQERRKGKSQKQAAATALATTKPGEGLNPLDKNNPWAFFDHYIDRVAAQCVSTLTPKWSTRLGGFDVFVWDQCYSMEQTLRIE